MKTLIANGTVVNADGSQVADVLVDGETIVALGHRAGEHVGERGPDHRCERTLRHPRRHRRAHPHGAAVRRHLRQGHLRDGHAGGRVRRHDQHHRLRGPVPGPIAPRGPRCVARQGRGQHRHRLRLPHDHERRQRFDARGDGQPWSTRASPTSSCSRPTRASSTPTTARSSGPCSGRSATAAPSSSTPRTASPSMSSRSRRSPPANTDPYYHGVVRYPIFEGEATNRVIRLAEAAGRTRVHRPHVRPRRASRPSRRRGTGARPRSARPAPSTCSCRSRTSATGSRAPSSCARRRSGPRSTRWTCGGPSSGTTSRSSPPTIARSTSTTRSSWARATSARSPTGCRASRTGMDLMHDGGVVAGGISKERWVEICSAAPGPDVRAGRAEGRRRRGRRRRPGGLRPGEASTPSPPRPITWTSTTPATRGARSRAHPSVVLSRGKVIIEGGSYIGSKGDGRFLKRAVARDQLV